MSRASFSAWDTDVEESFVLMVREGEACGEMSREDELEMRNAMAERLEALARSVVSAANLIRSCVFQERVCQSDETELG